ncbi:type II toxin-antitoxin system RelE family toxin [Verminephrobacter aporrectodeae]|uniref:Type II toxin-antitoxin system RelE/ParE family toxin n=1 Tax=Verminephrobacter aporrectodeae subsp. tuberculatae TaxID=1110392 RepID=A0ABT3KZG4_9BURK|nr:type II toxin-antitoxin system RelE/ParE family toxin [Verminephrobacter aporrectodeae]MCW5256279.1 type II toxin-antitoxin system RelE/ParE family toxin [Verminephrobacter aporrectodeae subsp. tuberculatae]MCW5323362.1 type II toxin-antitoxin system RelE/ParE family toxin [Verminephrobacter aporrectodeae subsp. tuberculatae]MCW8165690.1 type II toxin-antitoxin system RelE/ParE family toxin [Verminephrobacter aporrectodeae subsp. tuberculatae]MCW8169663.1 type II toxin-antitoxin system RelE/
MVWKVELDPAAERELGKIDQQSACRILAFLHGRVAQLDDPRSIGEALKGSKLGVFWKYRVGDWRIIAGIEDGALRILVIRIGNRKDVYRK